MPQGATTRPEAESRRGLCLSPVERLVATAAGIGLLMWTTAAVAAVYATTPVRWKLAVVVASISLAELARLHVRYGADRVSCTWGGASLLVGFVLVGPAWFVTLAAPCVLTVHLLARRGWMTAIYNSAAYTCGATAAYVVVQVVAVPPLTVRSARDAAGLLLGALAYSACSHVGIAVAVAVTQRTTFSRVVREGLRRSALVWLGNVVIGGAALVLVARNPIALIGLPTVLGAVFVAYRGLLNARQERDIWGQLEAATRELNQLEESQIAAAALRRAQQLFHVDGAELQLAGSGHRPPRVYALTAEGAVVCRLGSGRRATPPGTTSFIDDDLRGAPALVTDVVAALTGPRGELGSLRLTSRDLVRFRARERHVLRTFAHAVATTVLNAALYDDVRSAVSRRAFELPVPRAEQCLPAKHLRAVEG